MPRIAKKAGRVAAATSVLTLGLTSALYPCTDPPEMEGTCGYFVQWYYANTDMSAEAIHDWHILCLETWGCTIL